MSSTATERGRSDLGARGGRYCLLAATAVVATLLTLSIHVPSAHADTVIGAGGTFFFDEGEFVGERRVSIQRTDLDEEFANDSFVSGALWVLFDASERVRMGAAYKFYGTYHYAPEDRDDDEDQVRELGLPMEFVYLIDLVLPMTSDFDFLLGAQVGAVLLVPSGDFERRIESLQDQGVDVVDGPRIGYVVGPTVGMKWNINEMFAIRSDFGARWQQIFLFATEQDVAGTPFGIDLYINNIRYEVNAGLEVAF